jgi:hypothetical protein
LIGGGPFRSPFVCVLQRCGMPPVSVPLLMLDLETVEGQQAGAF